VSPIDADPRNHGTTSEISEMAARGGEIRNPLPWSVLAGDKNRLDIRIQTIKVHSNTMHSAKSEGGRAVLEDKRVRSGLRMRDIVRETGLPRETIHFYLAEGLLPPPTKTGRNTALYGWEHVRRARLVKSIQEKHFLPLRAIRALLEDADDSSLSAAQQG